MGSIPLPIGFPPLALSAALAAVLLVAVARPAPARGTRLLAVAALLGALAWTLSHWGERFQTELLRWDGLGAAWMLLLLLGSLPLALLIEIRGERPLALLLGTVLGMALLATANHLFLLFLGLEIMSLSLYLLVALTPNHADRGAGSSANSGRRIEAAIKYFFCGAFVAAIYLFGLSIYYAKTGGMAMRPHPFESPGLALAVTLMVCAALFKIGAFPMHFWLPDVYEAAAPELSAFMSTTVKAAGILLLARLAVLLPHGNTPGPEMWLPWIALATMTLGNLLALRQTNLQRLLAYSSLSHVGYLLAGVWAWFKSAGAPEQAASIYFYLLTYLFMSMGAFLFVKAAGVSRYDEIRGLSRRSPGLAAFFALMLLSLAGIPPTGGFLAKFFILWDVLRSGSVWLAVAIALNSLIGLGYYFSLIQAAVFDEPVEPGPASPPITLPARLTLWACSLGTLILGLLPGVRTLLAACLER
ncbi:MAG: NADH-quinone oxidoreductase subunit N [Elusimicrobia bacterium]|nr:NADH-quinone oxidoreductase subunit N [Elusimicrobiota bacterium]